MSWNQVSVSRSGLQVLVLILNFEVSISVLDLQGLEKLLETSQNLTEKKEWILKLRKSEWFIKTYRSRVHLAINQQLCGLCPPLPGHGLDGWAVCYGNVLAVVGCSSRELDALIQRNLITMRTSGIGTSKFYTRYLAICEWKNKCVNQENTSL